MSNFQSIVQEYRQTDFFASGIPIEARFKLLHMGQKVRTDFGNRLFDSRRAAGLSQAQLANAAGLGQATITELETIGQGSSAVTKLAKAVGVNPHWLATGEGQQEIPGPWPFDLFTFDEYMTLPEEYRRHAENDLAGEIQRVLKRNGTQ